MYRTSNFLNILFRFIPLVFLLSISPGVSCNRLAERETDDLSAAPAPR